MRGRGLQIEEVRLGESSLPKRSSYNGAGNRPRITNGGNCITTPHEIQRAEPAMSEKPKRRWYQFSLPIKYSLQSLMIGITLFCVLLGGRIEYLRRYAAFHEREARILASRLKELSEPRPGVGGARVVKNGTNMKDFYRMAAEFAYHQRMQKQYSSTVYLPWTLVRDDRPKSTTPPDPSDPFAN
jgi:hypothetical protein